MFSATADSKTLGLAKNHMKKDFCHFNMHQYETSPEIVIDAKTGEEKTLPPLKINHYCMVLPYEAKLDTLYSFIKSHQSSKCIVFF
jgi:superfamily II DNA/RNA helicase